MDAFARGVWGLCGHSIPNGIFWDSKSFLKDQGRYLNLNRLKLFRLMRKILMWREVLSVLKVRDLLRSDSLLMRSWARAWPQAWAFHKFHPQRNCWSCMSQIDGKTFPTPSAFPHMTSFKVRSLNFLLMDYIFVLTSFSRTTSIDDQGSDRFTRMICWTEF